MRIRTWIKKTKAGRVFWRVVIGIVGGTVTAVGAIALVGPGPGFLIVLAGLGILATELVALDQDIDLYANFVMQNGAKPSGIFSTTQVIPDAKYKEVAQRLKETWNAMTGGRTTDQSKAGQGMLLDQGMSYTPVDMLTLQDAQTSELKTQTMKRLCGLFGVPPAMLGISDQKYNNTQTMLDEFYKSTMSPMIKNITQKLKQHLFKGYPSLHIQFDTTEFLEGSPLDQMNFAVAGVNAGVMTPNEAREFLGMAQVDGANELLSKSQSKPQGDIAGTSPQDTGGGGGNQTRKMNIGK
jgi:phage portal protein BeeE